MNHTESSSPLTEKQTATLRAAIDRIIPADDYPGGWDLGVSDYLNRQFQRDLRDKVGLYRAGLDALDQAAAARGGDFASLGPERQDAILSSLESGQAGDAWPIDPARFFQMLVEHAMEGCYSDPGNGGNRGGTSWEMIGFRVTDSPR